MSDPDNKLYQNIKHCNRFIDCSKNLNYLNDETTNANSNQHTSRVKKSSVENDDLFKHSKIILRNKGVL